MRRTLLAYVGVILVITACSLLPAKTFNEKYAIAVAGATAALTTTDTLYNARKLTVADARNIERQIDNVKEALDLAKAIYATDEATGGDKLASATTALQALQTYLTQQQGK
jgi:putative intracellular protease/amidase